MEPADSVVRGQTVVPGALAHKLRLRSGLELQNRFVKAALSENCADLATHNPSGPLLTLSHRFGRSGCGLQITGHVMVCQDGMSEPKNVVYHEGDEQQQAALREWAEACQCDGCPAFVQLNHAGRQSPKFLSPQPVAPSAIPMEGAVGQFGRPREATLEDVQRITEAFGTAAAGVQAAGFAGVEIHCAHGYLCSQFLSPKTNRRTDAYGGSIENRRGGLTCDNSVKFLLEVYKSIRRRCGPRFPVAVKLNVGDFVRGGFEFEDALVVARKLDETGVDFIEISGGTYESPVFAQKTLANSTREREAYFLRYAEALRNTVDCPLMLTGGLRTPAGMAQLVSEGQIDLIGLGRPLCVEPEFPREILEHGRLAPSVAHPHGTWIRALLPKSGESASELAWYQYQLSLMASGKDPIPNAGLLYALLWFAWQILKIILTGKRPQQSSRGRY